MTGEGGEVNVKEDLEGVKRAEAVWGGRMNPAGVLGAVEIGVSGAEVFALRFSR